MAETPPSTPSESPPRLPYSYTEGSGADKRTVTGSIAVLNPDWRRDEEVAALSKKYAANRANYAQALADESKAADEARLAEYKKAFPEGFPIYSPHNYILELGAGRDFKVEDSVSLFYVTSVQMQQPHALERRWTLSRVYEQSSGSRERIFSISGRTGDQPLDIARFFKLRNFIEKYYDKKKSTENAFSNSRKYKLRLNMNWEGEKFETSILNFSYQRESGNTTNSYIWNITLASNNYYDIKSPGIDYDGVIAAQQRRLAGAVLDTIDERELAAQKGERERLLNDPNVSATVKAALRGEFKAKDSTSKAIKALLKPISARNQTTWFDDVAAAAFTFNRAAIKTAETFVSLSFAAANIYRRGVTPALSMFQTAAYAASTMAGAVVSTLPNLQRAIISSVNDAKDAYRQLESAWSELSVLGTSDYWESLFEGLPSFGSNRRGRLFVVANNVSQPVIAQLAPSGNSTGGGSGQQDAYNLAGIFLGDRSRWRDIMEVNRMPDPYTREDGSPLQVGDIVLIPDADGSPAIFTSDSLFGSDLMVKDGDLVMRGSGGLQTVSGEDNLRQSLSHRLRTVRGTNRIFPEFGLSDFIGEKQTSSLVAQVWSDIQQQVSADRRVSTVIRILIDEQPMSYSVWLSFQMANHEVLSSTFEYTPPI
jgi:hypothetical protein